MESDPNIIEGRPDFECYRRGEQFGVTFAKKFPPYVFSVVANSALVHKIERVELHWWEAKGSYLQKLHKPRMIAVTVCGTHKFLTADRTRTCMVPNPDAMLCGKCHGLEAPFSKHGWATKAGIKRTEAHVKLGCVVKGY